MKFRMSRIFLVSLMPWLTAGAADADLRINELMAANDSTITDEFGEYDDWFEVINTGPSPISLSGFFASDGVADSLDWAFPDTALGPGDVLLVWADNDGEQGPLHAGFKLSGAGEALVLWDSMAAIVDSVTFGAIGADTSYARMPDGDGPWMLDVTPTPGELNDPSDIGLPAAPGSPGPVLRVGNASPNPFNPHTLIPVELLRGAPELVVSIHDLAGRRVRLLHRGPKPAGRHHFAWDGTNSLGHGVASGAYLVTVRSQDHIATTRIILAK